MLSAVWVVRLKRVSTYSMGEITRLRRHRTPASINPMKNPTGHVAK